MIVVANAGPLISLAQISLLHLLPSLFGHVRIPPAVHEEVVTSKHTGKTSAEVDITGWLQVTKVRHTTAVELLRERLGAGESEAIVLAIESRAALLLIDEKRGRRVAESQGVEKSGTLGVLIPAKRRGLIDAVQPLLLELKTAGFRMSEELYQRVLSVAGER